jgi:branched-chain amino acid transport system substrate-binding protein
MRRPTRRFVPLAAAAAVTALTATACGTSATTSASSTAQPITVGISLPLTGQFAADGQATRNGYELWASDVNTNGGLLHRPVKLVILNDNSNEKTVTSDYNTLINQDHVNLTLAPFSTLLTNDAQPVTAKYGYALVAGSATGGLVFQKAYRNFFSVSLPVKLEMASFAKWVLTLPASDRQTAAYPEVSDPFADPPVDQTEKTLSQHGVKQVYWNSGSSAAVSNKQIHTAAVLAAQKHPQIVVIGSVDLPSLLIFIHTFEAMKYTPKIMIAASGPDQGQAFLNSLDPANAQDIMVPDGWFGGEQNALSHVMVEDYIAKFGGTSADINADVAEAYSAGEVLADAVTADKNLSNAKIINYLHSGVTLQTVQGKVKFQPDGENLAGQAFIFQWQNNGQFIPVLGPDTGTHGPVASKPPFQTG